MGLLKAEHISKQFPGTLALDDVSVQFDSGRVHAFIGKNGSGKSTLLKIFAGAIQPTSGKFYLDNKELHFNLPSEALNQGIATVYQELSLVPSISVYENILLGRLPLRHGLVDLKSARERALELLKSFDLSIDPDINVDNLSAGEKQMVEITKAMSTDPKVLLLDEPTAALSKSETEALFQMIRRLRDRGVIIIYVSHKLQELWSIADTCTVLRDGKLVGTKPLATTSRTEIVQMMFGDVQIKTKPSGKTQSEDVAMRVEALTGKKFRNITFDLHKGEILGIAGMLGSGRTEILRAIFGADDFSSGKIYVNGELVHRPTPRLMKNKGVALVTENRNTEGVVQCLSIRSNLCRAAVDRTTKNGLVQPFIEKELSSKQIEDLQIKISSDTDIVTSLSGGNVQKVVVGGWLNTQPNIILFDEPSKGIDVAAKQQIFQIMWNQADKGISCIMVSTELEELLEVCDRILILRDGELCGELMPEGITGDRLYTICMGDE